LAANEAQNVANDFLISRRRRRQSYVRAGWRGVLSNFRVSRPSVVLAVIDCALSAGGRLEEGSRCQELKAELLAPVAYTVRLSPVISPTLALQSLVF